MKVKTITERHRKADNKEYWSVELEGEGYPLLVFDKPTFAEGSELSKETLQFNDKGSKSFFTLPKAALKPTGGRQYQPKDDLWIVQQTCFKAAVDLTLPSMQVKPLLPTTATIEELLKLTETLLHGMIEIRSRITIEKHNADR